MKRKIKAEIFEKRKALSKEEINLRSEKIKEKLYSLEEFKKAKNIMIYAPFNNEVDTIGIIREFFKKNGNNNIKKIIASKKIIVPYIIKNNPILQLSELESMDDLEPKTFGILEPKEDKIRKFDADKLDLVIVPGIAFDKCGHRIGYGRGYYDKFFGHLGEKAKKMALAFDFQIIDKILEEKHDVAMDIIITEKNTIYCNKD